MVNCGVLDLHSLYSHSTAVFDDYLVHFGITSEVKVIVNGSGGVNVSMSAIATSAGLPKGLVTV